MTEEALLLAELHLRHLGGCKPIPEWREITWLECDDCGAAAMCGPASDHDGGERLWDGEPVVCAECGAVSTFSADADGWCVADAHGELVPMALAGFRRLVRW